MVPLRVVDVLIGILGYVSLVTPGPKSHTNGLLCVAPNSLELSNTIEYTGDESFPGAWTLHPLDGCLTSQNATTLCRAVPAAT